MRRGTIVFLALMTCACGFFGSNPKKSVKKFLNALGEGNYQEAYEHVSAKDKEFKDLQTFMSEPASKWLPEGVAIDSDYEIQSVDIDGSRAEVRVTFSGAAGGEEGEAGPTHVYRAIKDEGGWGVFLSWEAESLLAEAKRLQDEGKLREAQKMVNKALEVDPNNPAVLEASTNLERAMIAFERKDSYRRNHVEILNFRVRPDDRRAGPGTSVSGKILNNGHISLREVEVTVYFVSTDGKIISQQVFQPIPSADITYIGEKGLLKRGYVKDFGYIIDTRLPATWSGRARALITNIEFEEST